VSAQPTNETAQLATETAQTTDETTPEAIATPQTVGGAQKAELSKLGEIAFVLDDDIWVIDADGSDLRNLTNNDRNNIQPAWSPDGRYIAFSSGGDIYVMDADGANLRKLTNHHYANGEPGWLPDGRIVYDCGDKDCWWSVMDADGSNPHCLVDWLPVGASPAWSPDGRSVAFVSADENLYVAAADGSNPQALTHLEGGEVRDPTWSPDGRHIAFGWDPYDGDDAIYVTEADGSSQRWLAQGEYPTWSPDGRYIAFFVFHGVEIWVIEADGSNPRILDALAVGTELAWSPVP
jgi:TolB protein